ncbi:hypothetical protein BKA58DRAFT_379442 [Alternaria rosae]|uniref:uncharacterized protein n=1 Tax=Alternaria rosae TaxID=1187941 RepID=UPI001E8D5D7C|nr:uncharacterized protein BKA58DRAFT_379442 [Alternaria rosae]KAH6875225.1 hypothetical protein BKA58DRAFT_379442 [Alternaria rosae]
MARLNGCFPKLLPTLTGWRRLAILNIGAMTLLTLLLCGFTVASILKTDLTQIGRYHINGEYNFERGAAVRNGFLFHSSPCREPTAGNINTVLHLLVNAVSSAILASSSFFSQVLSSPTRAEVDVSHARGRSVDVGVLSWRNALRLSPFKTVAWVALLVTSLPLHLLFNSAILQSVDSEVSLQGDDAACYVGVSNPLLLTVTLACLVKVIICVTVVWVLGRQEPLVTPGDAVASFISMPDPSTAGRLDMLIPAWKHGASIGSPILWRHTPRRRASCLSSRTWAYTYILFIACIAAAAGILGKEYHMIQKDGWLPASFRDSSSAYTIMPPKSSVPFITTMLLANIPQLVLSVWYLAYNAILTRLQLSQEWALLSASCRPLRVSQPKGRQVGTYRLQLPYRYSILLISLSAVMHFLLSKSSFVLLYTDDDHSPGFDSFEDLQTLPRDLLVAWGLSPTYLAALLALAVTAIQIPWLLGLLRLPGYMPPVGSDSQAIAAACHVSPLAKAPLSEQMEGKGEGYEPVSMADEEGNSGLLAVSRSLLSWGVVKMPQDWYDAQVDRRDSSGTGRPVEHLSFGTALDGVKRPIRGRFYS